MPRYEHRFYRERMKSPDLVSFTVKIEESDLYILAEQDLRERAWQRLQREREDLKAYIRYDPNFRKTLTPLAVPPFAPRICQIMAQCAQNAGVGPMAAVAGAINEMLAEELFMETGELVIENGGDILVFSQKERIVAIYAGEESPFSFRVGLVLPGGTTWGVATSSGKVGPSLSFGNADAVVVVSHSAALSDAWATSLANRVKGKGDLEKVVRLARDIPGIEGVVVIVDDVLGVEGNIRLTNL
ncbi:MAG: UPF0280 family protein [Atribacterota bacterium]